LKGLSRTSADKVRVSWQGGQGSNSSFLGNLMDKIRVQIGEPLKRRQDGKGKEVEIKAGTIPYPGGGSEKKNKDYSCPLAKKDGRGQASKP